MSGFYKLDPSGELLYGEIVTGDGVNLTPYEADQQVDGWAWFESDAAARDAYDIVPDAADLPAMVEYLTAEVATVKDEKATLVKEVAALTAENAALQIQIGPIEIEPPIEFEP